jgi:hypothetical protein
MRLSHRSRIRHISLGRLCRVAELAAARQVDSMSGSGRGGVDARSYVRLRTLPRLGTLTMRLSIWKTPANRVRSSGSFAYAPFGVRKAALATRRATPTASATPSGRHRRVAEAPSAPDAMARGCLWPEASPVWPDSIRIISIGLSFLIRDGRTNSNVSVAQYRVRQYHRWKEAPSGYADRLCPVPLSWRIRSPRLRLRRRPRPLTLFDFDDYRAGCRSRKLHIASQCGSSDLQT